MTVAQQIARGARLRGLDPSAVLAVAGVEGLGATRPGDHGTSFGPFQLHMGGALPRGHYGDAAQWSSSPQGIAYALNQIDHVAHGLHGRQAVAAIVNQFERPQHPGAEIAKAWGRYGNLGGGPAAGPSLTPPAAQAAAPEDLRKQIGMALLGAVQPGAQHGDYSQLYAILGQQQAAAAHPAQLTPHSRQGQPAWPGASRPGGGINELFYDPLGGIKHGKQIGAIGGHSDHVHMALANAEAQGTAIAHALAMGLHVSEDDVHDRVDPVHVKGSYHYKHYPHTHLAEAADISGSPRLMAAFDRWVARRYGG